MCYIKSMSSKESVASSQGQTGVAGEEETMELGEINAGTWDDLIIIHTHPQCPECGAWLVWAGGEARPPYQECERCGWDSQD